MIVDFNKFERASIILESLSPDQATDTILNESGLTREDLLLVNEGLLGDLFGGWWNKVKTSLLRSIPGGVLKKVDEIIRKYETEKIALMKKGLGEKEKLFKAEASKEANPDEATKHDQIISRANAALKAIRTAGSAKIDKFNLELEQLAKDKSEMVSDYISLKVAEIKERVAMAEVKELESFATEEQVEKVMAGIAEMKKKREALQKEIELAAKEIENESNKDLGKTAKKGEKWVRRNKAGDETVVEVIGEPNVDKKGEVRVKGDNGTEYSATTKSFLRKGDKVETKEDPKKSKINKLEKEEDAEA